MSPRSLTIKELLHRKTYIKGRFSGKFIGYLDHKKSDLEHENFYDIEVLEGKITISDENGKIFHFNEGEPNEFQPVEFFITKLPKSLFVEVTKAGTTKNYKIDLFEPKLDNFRLTNQVYENDIVFGDIYGFISGYLSHFDKQNYQLELPENVEIAAPKSKSSRKSSILYKTKITTGKIETSGNYKRLEHYFSDRTTYWGPWTKYKNSGSFSIKSVLLSIIQVILLLVAVIPFLMLGKVILFPLLIFGITYIALSIIPYIIIIIWDWFVKLLPFAFLLFFIYSIASIITSPVVARTIKKRYATNSVEEKKTIKLNPISQDDIISNFRTWEDYNQEKYSGNIEVKLTDFKKSSNFRNNLTISLNSTNQYNNIVSQIFEYDNYKLELLYSMFDSLKLEHNMDKMKFANVITSCIQDIPYTLILNGDCFANGYNDDFITSYLNNGGKCEGNVKYGLFSPTEFMGNLLGDCDTRTLLLFTILNHYNYDVVMLGSELYKHSVLGINLPYYGTSKIIQGRRYVLWETTEQGIPAGIIADDISEMRFWNVILMSNHKELI